jgi:nucleotide-binding universal stress UspA family protein
MYQNILAPVDLSHPETARRVVQTARLLADEQGSKITVLHVLPNLPTMIYAQLPDGYTDQVKESARQDLRKLIRDMDGSSKTGLLLRSGHPHIEILRVADEIDCDAIVVASHQPGMQDYLLGSVAGKVVRHAKCSVLIDRARTAG